MGMWYLGNLQILLILGFYMFLSKVHKILFSNFFIEMSKTNKKLPFQQVFEIKKCLFLAKAQIIFIRSCVNRYSWWNESCDLRFTQL